MHYNFPSRDTFREGTLHRQRYTHTHDPQECGEHQVACHQAVPSSMLQPPVAACSIIYEDHKDYCHAGTHNCMLVVTLNQLKVF